MTSVNLLKLRRDLVEPAIHFSLGKVSTIEHHPAAFLSVRNAFQRIGVEQNQVSAFADFNSTRVLQCAEELGGVSGRGTEDRVRRQTCFIQSLQFTMKRKAIE